MHMRSTQSVAQPAVSKTFFRKLVDFRKPSDILTIPLSPTQKG